MIDRMPREGYGYGVIRMTRTLTRNIAPLAQIELTDVQGHLRDAGVFEQVRQALHLPDDYTIMGIYVEPYRFTWCILIEAPGVPIPSEGEELPVLTPVYTHTWDFETGTSQVRLERVDVATNPHMALRSD